MQPTNVMASPIVWTKRASEVLIEIIARVTKKFWHVVIVLFLKNSSSIEFLHGSRSIGDERPTDRRRARFPSTISFDPLKLALRMF